MKLLLALALGLGSFALVAFLGVTSSSCVGKKEVEVDLPRDDDDEDEIDTTPLDCDEEERDDCPTGSDPEPAERDDVFPDLSDRDVIHTGPWGWSTGALDFRCCKVTKTRIVGKTESEFFLGWDVFDASGAPLGGNLEIVRGGSFDVEIDFTPEDVVRGLFLSTGGASETDLERFGTIQVVFEVEPL